ncbi:hypothetical protein PIB30_077635 [Stylosanthes scabra]|uniref:RRM domain-containing protein n=1 Tax=Stylosanthes scabra TaxID=79078 RepID=A0ABU6VSJ7_9FABA|nr:hypothetical protein [Stylosanthes scabra]
MRVERGKHGEVSGYVGRSHNGESLEGGGFALGVRRNSNKGYWWRVGTDVKTTVFVDNLPEDVAKRDMYKEFGRDSYITDIFVSRKQRLRVKGPFAFVRFQRFEGALRAINRLNGYLWKGRELTVTMPKFTRHGKDQREAQRGVTQKGSNLKITKKWVEVRRNVAKEGDRMERSVENAMDTLKRRKEVDVFWAAEQKDLLSRSLFGYSVKPIDFRKTMNFLLYVYFDDFLFLATVHLWRRFNRFGRL